MLYLQSGRLAPPKSSPHPPAKRPYTNSAAVWATCRRHVKDMGFLCDRIGHYRHGPRDLPCFSLMNVTKHGACQYALRSLSPPHGDSHNTTCKSTDYSLSLQHSMICTIYHDGPWTAALLIYTRFTHTHVKWMKTKKKKRTIWSNCIHIFSSVSPI